LADSRGLLAAEIDAEFLGERLALADAELARLALPARMTDALLALGEEDQASLLGLRYVVAMTAPSDLPGVEAALLRPAADGELAALAGDVRARSGDAARADVRAADRGLTWRTWAGRRPTAASASAASRPGRRRSRPGPRRG
jgi:hypothetical protein